MIPLLEQTIVYTDAQGAVKNFTSTVFIASHGAMVGTIYKMGSAFKVARLPRDQWYIERKNV